jgi:cytochrome P450
MAPRRAPITYPFPLPPTIYQPAPELVEIQRECPVAEVALPDGRTAWLVTRNSDVRRVFIDQRFSRAAAVGPDGPVTSMTDVIKESILTMDPPQHTRMRKLIAGAFTARRAAELRPRIGRLVDELIDAMQLLPRPVDLVAHFSLPLPVQVICELLGVPADDRDRFHGWSDTLLTDVEPATKQSAFQALTEYLMGLVAAKRVTPGEDLMTALIAARDEQDKLSERELVMLCFTLLIAGHETTANQINLFLLTLLHHPDELAGLRADPQLTPRAVEELMRYVQLGTAEAAMARIATEPVELSGVTIPAGGAVLPALSLANRDPAVFRDPDRLDLSRVDNPHVGFGTGIHHCLGAQLARIELQEALHGLLRRLPNLRVVVPDSQLRFKPGMAIRSLESLPVTW